VGTTIYPGMQFTAVAVHRYFMSHWSLNDVCCYLPAWFGAIATTITGMIAFEATLPQNSASNLGQFLLDILHQQKNDKSSQNVTSSFPSFHALIPAMLCAVFTMAMMAIVPGR